MTIYLSHYYIQHHVQPHIQNLKKKEKKAAKLKASVTSQGWGPSIKSSVQVLPDNVYVL